MRFKKGSKVEVLSRKAVPSGSWHCAEIICGNGHNYTVRYYGHSAAANKMIVERVSRKAIRPCPPPLETSDNWTPGDVIEVFDNFSWKMATVLQVLGENCILVRLLGSSLEFKVSKFDVRIRQSWQDDQWFIIGMGSSSFEDGEHGAYSTCKYNQSSYAQNTNKKRNDIENGVDVPVKNKVVHQDSLIASFKNLKRKCNPQIKASSESERKVRAMVIAANPSSIPEEAYPVAFSRDMLGLEHMHAFNNRKSGLLEVDAGRKKPSGAAGCSFAENLESRDADSVTCSVGSCSVSSNNFCKLRCHISTGPIEDVQGQFSDAESCYQWEDEEGSSQLPTREELAAEIHRLELHAYRSTMEALHASGPLSWEQEALVTNLRLSLHISNDEHLMQLRNLISADNSIPIR